MHSANLQLEDSLYGACYRGGSTAWGAVFKINADGTGFTSLHDFAGPPGEGAISNAGLALAGNTLYGTTSTGGGSGDGTIFAVNVDGTAFANRHSFTGLSGKTNLDGAAPIARLALLGSTLYENGPFGRARRADRMSANRSD